MGSTTSSARPTVSFGVPVYNGEAGIDAALESLRAQTFDDLEIIVSDNASTDGTEEICRSHARLDPRVRYVRNERNVGVARNFNGLFRLASGRYFKWAPHDDVVAPEFLARCVEALEADPAVAIAVPTPRLIDEAPTAHLADLVDGIGELKAAVLCVDGCLLIWRVAAVDINEAGHDAPG